MVPLKMFMVFLSLLLPFIAPTFAFSSFSSRPCCYGTEVIPHGDVIASFPGQCMQLFCNDTQAETRYYDSPEDCGCCEFNDKMYKTGERIKAVCTDIKCHHGKWVTTGHFDECCKKCSLRNDPHITTFDGHYYHWHGICNYSISQLESGYDEEYGIYGAFRRCNGKASCIDQTTFTDNPNTVIEIGYNQGANVKVNNADYTVKGFIEAVNVGGLHPVLAWRRGNCNMFLGSQGYLLMTCGNELVVWGYPNLLGQVNGLCGHYNMYKPDDFTERDGVQLPLTLHPYRFPNCWKTINQTRPDCKLVPGEEGTANAPDACQASAGVRAWLKDVCKSLLSPVRWHSHKFSDFLFNVAVWSCVSDLCVMKENGASEKDIEEWKKEMRLMLIINIEIEVKTTVGANPPHDDDDHSSCGGGCGHAFHLENSIKVVLNSGSVLN